jgi:beta-lactamase superfamily II metal-dependent hydrolase
MNSATTTSALPDAATGVDQPKLELHILNAGYGESIVIHTPDGKWGVVDCYASSGDDLRTNPTLCLLQHREVTDLEFVCLTHPHSDHYRGILQLFDEFQVRSFWRYGAISPKQLFQYLKGDAGKRGYDDDRERRSKDADVFLAIMRRVQERIDRKDLEVEHLTRMKLLYRREICSGGNPDPVPFEIHSIAPSSTHVEQYQQDLRQCLDDDGRLKATFPRLRHNDISAALLLRYGATSVTLGGDVERVGWQDLLDSSTCPSLASQAVKVSHHGSSTGYCEGLWAALSPRRLSVAVITPSARHRLPTRVAVEHIQKHAQDLIATCLMAVPFAAGESTPAERARHSILGLFMPDLRPVGSYSLGICSVTCGADGEVHTKPDGAAGRIRV